MLAVAVLLGAEGLGIDDAFLEAVLRRLGRHVLDALADLDALVQRMRIVAGALLGNAPKAKRDAITRYGEVIGQAFQIADDILDYTADQKKLGKTVGDDFREGLTAVISVKVAEPQFEGQTKHKLGNGEVKGIVEAAAFDLLSTFLEENPAIARQVIDKVYNAAIAREAARKARV